MLPRLWSAHFSLRTRTPRTTMPLRAMIEITHPHQVEKVEPPGANTAVERHDSTNIQQRRLGAALGVIQRQQ